MKAYQRLKTFDFSFWGKHPFKFLARTRPPDASWLVAHSSVARPKFWEEPRILTLGKQENLVLKHLLSKYKMIKYARNFRGHDPLIPPGYVCGCTI